ncbi:protein of unknown function [Azospirillum lipoferum 4B]|uniref:Uncharacterized protein n=1 Tax=Azospirillum lipoferum (strain 4B) TaxID=862719 RepID=G7Z4G2_AZOL4|nr:protein of unknown function [Azospirillum lipoferum 4B]
MTTSSALTAPLFTNPSSIPRAFASRCLNASAARPVKASPSLLIDTLSPTGVCAWVVPTPAFAGEEVVDFHKPADDDDAAVNTPILSTAMTQPPLERYNNLLPVVLMWRPKVNPRLI